MTPMTIISIFVPLFSSIKLLVINLGMIALGQQYLANNFNHDLGLYREAPNVAPNTYWIYSDNHLAKADISGYTVPVLRKWLVLDGCVVPDDVFTYGSQVRDLGNGIKTEVEDSSVVFADWQEYADRVLLAAINEKNAHNGARFRELMSLAHAMWDGSGMRDKAFVVDGKYETYKTALYYFITNDPKARNVLAQLQGRDPADNHYGGWYTHYVSPDHPAGDTNTETTAIVLRALGGLQ